VLDLAFGVGGLDEAEPVAAGAVAFLRENFHHVAAHDFVAQRDHLAVHFGADALVADFGVHGVGKINWGGAPRQFQDASFGSEGIDLDGREIHFQGGEKFSGLLKFLGPLDELAHPGDALVIVIGGGLATLIFPMRGHAFFGDAVHFLRANLHLEGLAAVEHGGVQRLVKIRAGHGDVVFEAAGDGAPDVMDDAERGVAVPLGIGDHANGEQIVDLLEAALLADHFLVQGEKAFDASFKFSRNACFHQPRLNRAANVIEKFGVNGGLVGDFFLEGEEGVRFEIAKGEIFEFAADDAHAEAMRDGSVNVERFPGDALLLARIEIFERAHVVEAVRELHEYDADVVHHGEQHFADIFGLARFRRHHVQTANFCDALDEVRDFRTEALFNAGDGILGVFDGIVEEGGSERGGIQAHVGKDVGDLEKMSEVRFAGAAELCAVALGSDFVGAANNPGIFGRAVLAQLFEEFLEACVELALGAVAIEVERDVARRRHRLFYA